VIRVISEKMQAAQRMAVMVRAWLVGGVVWPFSVPVGAKLNGLASWCVNVVPGFSHLCALVCQFVWSVLRMRLQLVWSVFRSVVDVVHWLASLCVNVVRGFSLCVALVCQFVWSVLRVRLQLVW